MTSFVIPVAAGFVRLRQYLVRVESRHADELRKSRPEALVGLITAPVVLLSVFGGKVAMARNGLSCACAAGLAVYGANFWEQRK